MTTAVDWDVYHQKLADTTTFVRYGRVSQVIGLTIEVQGLQAQIGDLCYIIPEVGQAEIPAEVMGFRDHRTLLMPLGEMQGIGPGSAVRATGTAFMVPVGNLLLGRVLNGLGQPIDDKGPLLRTCEYSSTGTVPPHWDANAFASHLRQACASLMVF